ncbi:MAG: hypothetical protein K2J07_03025, partial [Muribaculaceae bacterium]|nr:hypothetical protein [Muribaculaceae bacterium]
METSLSDIINTPLSAPLDAAQVAQLMRQAPACVYPLILQLRHPHPALTEEQTADIVQRIALSIPDMSRLRILLDPEGTGEFDRFYPAAAADATPSTNDTIDTFLATYGHSDPAEDELLNRLIFNPVPADYALSLGDDAPLGERDEQDSLLDAFISSHSEEITPAPKTEPPATPEPTPAAEPEAQAQPAMPQGGLLSQSLAKIFIKQGHYRQAYEIIHSLSLNYPEKSIYFADQLRFLRKLI